VECRAADGQRGRAVAQVPADLVHPLVDARPVPGGPTGDEVYRGAESLGPGAQRQAELRLGPPGVEAEADGVVGNEIGDPNGRRSGLERRTWSCTPNRSEGTYPLRIWCSSSCPRRAAMTRGSPPP
jgi:hypothetical protein